MRKAVSLAVGTVIAVAVPIVAHAKGASEASVTGPGLAAPIVFAGYGPGPEPPTDGGAGLARLSTESGIYSTIFEEAPGPGGGPSSSLLESNPPAGDLGPRYTLTYSFPFSEREARYVTQHVYPYAAGSPTYTPTGQRLFGKKVRSGWHTAGAGLQNLLIEAGLPARPPASTSVERSSAAPAANSNLYLAVFAGLAAVAAFTALVWRRRPGPLRG